MPCWPVSYRDGVYQVTDRDGVHHPITMARQPVEGLNPGWEAVGLQTGLPPFHLLELRHDGPPEMDAVWYLSDELEFIANTPQHFSQEQAAAVVAALSPLLRDIHDETLCAPAPAVAASSHVFDGINPAFAHEMIGFVVETALSPPDMVMAQRLEGVSAHYTVDGNTLSTSLLRHSLDVAMPAPGADPVMLASPFDATLLDVQEQFQPVAGPVRQVFRFRDPVRQMTLYLLFQPDGGPALYMPAMNTVFAAGDGLSGAQVMTTLLGHYACHTDRVLPLQAGDDTTRAQAAPAAAATQPAVAVAASPDEPDATASTPHPKWWKRLFGPGSP